MKKEYSVRLAEEVVMRAKDAGIDLCVPVENKMTLDVKDNCVPDVSGICIGKVNKDTDKLESNIKDDENAEKLRAYIDNGLVVTKVFSQMTEDRKELKNVPHYFMVYNVMESSKQRETYTESSVGFGTPINGHYECEYEVLLGSEEYTRRMVFKESSVNISMYDWLNSLMDNIEEGLDEEDEEIMKHFYKSFDGEVYFTMFDEVGLTAEVEFERAEFESMIVGIRQISCEFVDDEQ